MLRKTTILIMVCLLGVFSVSCKKKEKPESQELMKKEALQLPENRNITKQPKRLFKDEVQESEVLRRIIKKHREEKKAKEKEETQESSAPEIIKETKLPEKRALLRIEPRVLKIEEKEVEKKEPEKKEVEKKEEEVKKTD